MLKKTLTLLTGSITGKLIQFTYFFWIVKLLSPDDFGQYAVALTLFLIGLYPVLEFGTELLINREASNGSSTYYYHVFFWKLFIFPFASSIIVIVGILSFNLAFNTLALTALLIFFRSLENSSAAFLRGKDLSRVESIHLITSRGVSIILLAVAVAFDLQINIELGIAFQIAGILLSILLIEGKHLIVTPLPILEFKILKEILAEGFPLALNSIGWLIYYKIDVLLISILVSNSDAGSYEISYKLLETTFIIPAVIMAVVFRKLVLSESASAYKKATLQVSLILGLVGIAVAGVSVLVLPYIFPMVFNNQPIAVVKVFNILSLSIPLVFIAHLTTQTLVIQKQSMKYLYITLSGACLNLCLNLALIPQLGVYGAATATVTTELFILITSGYIMLRYLKYAPHFQV